MLNKVKQVIKLQKELEQSHKVLSILPHSSEGTPLVHMYSVSDLISLVGSLSEVKETSCEDGYLEEISIYQDGVRLFVLMDRNKEAEYEQIKKHLLVTDAEKGSEIY